MQESLPAKSDRPAETAVPLNRAARRAKGRIHDTVSTHEREFGSRARAAQGRRINPIRRTG